MSRTATGVKAAAAVAVNPGSGTIPVGYLAWNVEFEGVQAACRGVCVGSGDRWLGHKAGSERPVAG